MYLKVFTIIVFSIVFIVLATIPFIMKETPLWSSAWTSTFIALFLGMVAIFQDSIRNWLRRPELDIDFRLRPPDCHRTAFRAPPGSPGAVACYYFRMRIVNSGKTVAENVEVIAEELFKEVADGSFQQDRDFLPLNYIWSHFGGVAQNIQPYGMYKFCDLGFLLNPTAPQLKINSGMVFPIHDSRLLFWFDFAIQPHARPNYLVPGNYKVKITATATNAPPVSKELMISWTGNWQDDDRNMLGREIVIKPI